MTTNSFTESCSARLESMASSTASIGRPAETCGHAVASHALLRLGIAQASLALLSTCAKVGAGIVVLGIALDHYEQMYPFVLFHVAKIHIIFKLAKYCNRKVPPIIVEKNINRHFILVCNDIQRPTGIC